MVWPIGSSTHAPVSSPQSTQHVGLSRRSITRAHNVRPHRHHPQSRDRSAAPPCVVGCCGPRSTRGPHLRSSHSPLRPSSLRYRFNSAYLQGADFSSAFVFRGATLLDAAISVSADDAASSLKACAPSGLKGPGAWTFTDQDNSPNTFLFGATQPAPLLYSQGATGPSGQRCVPCPIATDPNSPGLGCSPCEKIGGYCGSGLGLCVSFCCCDEDFNDLGEWLPAFCPRNGGPFPPIPDGSCTWRLR
jgi:hypothetical protein